MILFVLGLVSLILSVVMSLISYVDYNQNKRNFRQITSKAIPASIALMALGVLLSSIVIVPAGHRAVLLRFQAVRGVMSEGIHVMVPIINSVQMMEVRTQKEVAQANAASEDLQVVSTTIAINFHIDPTAVGNLYKRVGMSYKDRIIDPAAQESIKMITAQYTAENLVKNRQEVKANIESDITRRLRAYDLIVETSGVSIMNFDFSQEFNLAIEQKQVAQQEAEKQRYILQKAELERQTAVTIAEGTAEAARINAAALQAQGGSMVIAREWINKWDGHLPQVASEGSMMFNLQDMIKR